MDIASLGGKVVAEVVTRGSSEGLETQAAGLEAVAAANARVTATTEAMVSVQGKTVASGEAVVTATEKTGQAALRAGSSLDRLLRQIDEQYRAEQRLAAGRSILDRSFEQGLITQAEHASRLDLLSSKYRVTNDNADKFGKTVGLSGYEMKNLGFQMNDVATMLASGASPFQVLATQGGQVYQILAGAKGGVTGALSDLTTRVTSIVSPMGLAAAGAGLLAGGAYWLATRTKDATEIIEKHEKALRSLSDAYDLAAKGQSDYSKRSVEGSKTDLLADRHDLEKTLAKEIAAARRGVSGMRTADLSSGDATFEPAYDRFLANVRDGHPAFVEFHDDLEKIAAANRSDLGLQKAAKGLEDMTASGYKIEVQLRKDADALKGIVDVARDGTGHLTAFTEAMSKLQTGVPDYLARGMSARSKFDDDLRKIRSEEAVARRNAEGRPESLSSIDAAVTARISAARDELAATTWRDVLRPQLKRGEPAYAVENLDETFAKKLAESFAAAAERGARLPTINEGFRTFADQERLYRKYGPEIAAKPGTSLHEKGERVDLGVAGLDDRSQAIIREELARRSIVNTNGERWHFGMQSSAYEERNQLDKTRFDKGESWNKTILDFEKQTKAIDDEAKASRKNADELIREKAVLDLVTAAKREQLTITPDLTAQIEREADQRLLAVKADEEWKKSIKKADDFRGESRSMLSGFLGDLERGTKASQAFGHVLERLRDKMTEKLSDTIIDQLLGKAGSTFGGGGGLFGGLFSGIGHFFGLFAEGGSIGGSGWGIVGEKGPEVVQGPASVTPFAKLPTATTQQASSPGPIAVTVHLAGAITSSDVAATVRAGVTQALGAYDANLSTRLGEIQLRGA